MSNTPKYKEVDYETIVYKKMGGYSTSEVDTGERWIDGKKIYRKVYSAIPLTTTASTTPAEILIDNTITTSNIKLLHSEVIKRIGTSSSDTAESSGTLVFINKTTGVYGFVTIVLRSNGLSLQHMGYNAGTQYDVIVEYTKV